MNATKTLARTLGPSMVLGLALWAIIITWALWAWGRMTG